MEMRRVRFRPTELRERAWFVWLWLEGWSVRAISQHTAISVTTVYRWIRRWEKEGNVNNRARSGRPRRSLKTKDSLNLPKYSTTGPVENKAYSTDRRAKVISASAADEKKINVPPQTFEDLNFASQPATNVNPSNAKGASGLTRMQPISDYNESLQSLTNNLSGASKMPPMTNKADSGIIWKHPVANLNDSWQIFTNDLSRVPKTLPLIYSNMDELGVSRTQSWSNVNETRSSNPCSLTNNVSRVTKMEESEVDRKQPWYNVNNFNTVASYSYYSGYY